MPNANAQAVAWTNNRARRLADELYRCYLSCKVYVQEWQQQFVAGLAAPTMGAVTSATTGGTLATGVASSYRVTALNPNGETTASTAGTVTTGAGSTNANTVNWTAVPGATGYNVYGRVAAGGEKLIATNVQAVSFVDTGAATPGVALPAANTTAAIPSDNVVVSDGAATDGRQPVTNAQVTNILTRAAEMVNWMENNALTGGSVTFGPLNTVLNVQVNGSPIF